jgi:hypothetical protein
MELQLLTSIDLSVFAEVTLSHFRPDERFWEEMRVFSGLTLRLSLGAEGVETGRPKHRSHLCLRLCMTSFLYPHFRLEAIDG